MGQTLLRILKIICYVALGSLSRRTLVLAYELITFTHSTYQLPVLSGRAVNVRQRFVMAARVGIKPPHFSRDQSRCVEDVLDPFPKLDHGGVIICLQKQF